MAKLPPTIIDASVTLTFTFVDNANVTYTTGAYFGYCTISDVRFESPNLNSTSGYSNLTDANGGKSLIAQEIAYAALNDLQQMLDPVYQMPYTGTDQGVLTTLRILNAKLATAGIYNRQLRGVQTAPDPAIAVALRMEAEMIVHDITSGAIDWSNVPDIVARARKPALHGGTYAATWPSPSNSDGSEVSIFSTTTNGTRFTRRVM